MKNTAVGIFFIDSDHNHVISNRFPYKSDIAAHGWDNAFAVELTLRVFAQLECFDVT